MLAFKVNVISEDWLYCYSFVSLLLVLTLAVSSCTVHIVCFMFERMV